MTRRISMSRYIVGVLFMFHLVGRWLVQHRFASILNLCAYPIRWAAGITFSVYRYHFPLLTFLFLSTIWRTGCAEL